jgi:hypothetical protein
VFALGAAQVSEQGIVELVTLPRDAVERRLDGERALLG